MICVQLIWGKGVVQRKYTLHGKKAASILLKLFIGGNKRCHATNALPLACERDSIF